MRIIGIYGADRCARALGHAVRPEAFLTKQNDLPMPWSVSTNGRRPGPWEVPN